MKSKPLTDVGSAGILLLLFAFYDWTGTQGHFLPDPRSIRGLLPNEQFSNQMADALLAGQLHLLVEPDPRLVALQDPYDPAQNSQFGPQARLHDASLYKGKYYLYFGLTPILTFFLPARLLGVYVPESIGVVVFVFVGLLWSVKLLGFLLVRCGLDPPRWMQWLMVLGLGLCNFSPFLLRDPDIYQVAIASGYCFQFAALYWLFSGTWGEEPHRGRLVLGSVCQGLALGARFNLLLAAPILPIAYGHFCWQGRRLLGREGIKTIAALFLPFGACLFLLGLSNFVRFDSWTEFGIRYQMSDINVQKWNLFDPHSILPGLYHYSVFPYDVNDTFPYVHLRRVLPDLPAGSVLGASELVGGMFVCVPFLAMLLMFPMTLGRAVRREKPLLGLSIAYFLGTGLALMLFVSFIFPLVTMRYLSDFSPFFLMPAFLLWCYLDEQVRPFVWRRRVFRVTAVAALLYSILINLAVGITGYFDAFALFNPAQYGQIRAACEAIRRLLVGAATRE
jgi:hypothetical protein